MAQDSAKETIENINTDDRFNIQHLLDSLAKCSDDRDVLNMEHYLIAFKELNRFFFLLGSVFSFVASDILSKVSILEKYMLSEKSDHYQTIQSMIEYETQNGLTDTETYPSGSRTLLRLHRSLEFIMSFMESLSTASSDAKSSVIAQNCYRETLAKHHPWLIQKGACIAMYTLPLKQQFMERVHGGACNDETVEFYGKMMGEIAVVSKKVYEETQKLYEANALLDLP